MQDVLSKKGYQEIIETIPLVSDDLQVYYYTTNHRIDNKYVRLLNDLIQANDEIIAQWLNITPKTFRNYKSKDLSLKDNTKEHIVLLLSLYKHGHEVFGSIEKFENWLMAKNYLLDGKAPMEFLDTISGIKFIDNRLTSIEYGENA
ncbi:MAG: DUF2384 domain-containing protein [Niabella sp.]|nr:DUF2384 domain-containing protein [Niabella sp.]